MNWNFTRILAPFAMVCATVAYSNTAPIPVSLVAPKQGVVGTPMVISASGSDVDGNLRDIYIYYRDYNTVPVGPWVLIGGDSVSGNYGEGEVEWTPPSVGRFQLHCGIYDTNNANHGTNFMSIFVDVIDDAPVPEFIEIPSHVFAGKTYRIRAAGSDADGNLKELRLYYDLPGNGITWIALTAWTPSTGGFYGTIATDWTPTLTGSYQLHLGVRDWDGQTHGSHETGAIQVVESVVSGTPVPPFPQQLSVPSTGYVGEPIYLSARVTDDNGDLKDIQFYCDYPTSGTTWEGVGSRVPLSGTDDTAGVIWTPTTPGTHKIHVGAFDESGLNHDNNTSGNYWLSKTIVISAPPPNASPPSPVAPLIVQGPITVDTGDEYNVFHDSDVATSGSVIIRNSGGSVFWSSGKITLGQGFSAKPGTNGSFAALIDSDMDGRSDTVENVDSDNDGILDGFEYEIIDFSFFDAVSTLAQVNGSDDFDNDGISNATEIANGTNAAGYAPGQTSAYSDLLLLPKPGTGGQFRLVSTEDLISD